jgi:HSP20 family molecular chaperone IbpA
VYRESTDSPYELVLAHDNLVDTDKVVAELKDGVLRVSLPKHEAVKPRKIAVN